MKPTLSGYPHLPIQAQLEVIRSEDTGKSRKRVTILGAGMAGLAAAYELARLGHNVEIIEASSRVGGRVHTHVFKDGTYGELGAMRVPATHDYTLHYIRELELKRGMFINSMDNNLLAIRDERIRVSEGQKKLFPRYPGLPRNYLSDESISSGGQIFGSLIEAAANSLSEEEKAGLFSGDLHTELLRHYDSLSLGEFLRTQSNGATQALTADYTGLETFWDKSFAVFLREEVVGTGNKLTHILGGMRLLPEGLKSRALQEGVVLRLGTHVKGFRRLPDGRAELRLFESTKGPYSETCDYVLCTLPFSVLRWMDLQGVSQAKRDAIAQITYVSAFKLLLHFDERFWEKGEHPIHGGASVTDKLFRQVYYPMPDTPLDEQLAGASQPARRHGSFHALAGTRGPMHPLARNEAATNRAGKKRPGALLIYNWGQDAQRLGNLHPERQVEVVLNMLEQLHPEARKHFTNQFAHMFWDSNPMTNGAFVLFRPGEVPTYLPGAVQPEGRIFFAGEHCSTDNGWIQGALTSSLRAVRELVSYQLATT